MSFVPSVDKVDKAVGVFEAGRRNFDDLVWYDAIAEELVASVGEGIKVFLKRKLDVLLCDVA